MKENNSGTVSFCLTLIIDALMVGSFCTAVTEKSLMSVVVLFALSYLGSFFELSKVYNKEKSKYRQSYLANAGIIVSMLLLGVCLTIAIGIVQLRVCIIQGKARILIQSYEESFWCFNSIDITVVLFLILLYPGIIHSLIYIVEILEKMEIDLTVMKKEIRLIKGFVLNKRKRQLCAYKIENYKKALTRSENLRNMKRSIVL